MTIAKPQTPGLIDTINAGYTVLNRRLWVLCIPIVLDLYLWFGTHLSLRPLFERLETSLTASAILVASDPQQQALLLERLRHTDMRAPLALLNYVPLVLPTLPPDTLPQSVGWLTITSLPELALALVVINTLALLWSSCFLTLLAGMVRNERYTLATYIRRVWQVMRYIPAYLFLLLGVGFLLGLPFLVLSALIVGLLPSTTVLVIFIWFMAGFWIYIYTGFAVEAILITQVGPLRAIYHSVHVVRRNFLSTIGLLLLCYVIIAGMGIVWQALAQQRLGLLLVIILSAYVSTGLTMARLVFYRTCWLRWQGMPV